VIQLPDRDVTVLFTNRALMTVEKQTGRSVLAIAEGFANGQSGLGDMVQLLLAGMQAARRDAREGGPPLRMDDALEVMDQAGFGPTAAVVMGAVGAVLGYSNEIEESDDPNL
jgi:hypothetical protein